MVIGHTINFTYYNVYHIQHELIPKEICGIPLRANSTPLPFQISIKYNKIAVLQQQLILASLHLNELTRAKPIKLSSDYD